MTLGVSPAVAAESPGLAEYKQGAEAMQQGEPLKALKFFMKSHELGNVNGSVMLGTLLIATKDENSVPVGIKVLKAASDKGSGDAMYSLGRAYQGGDAISKNMDEAVAYYIRAANIGHSASVEELNKLGQQEYEMGLQALENKQTEKAMKLLAEASDKGHPSASLRLGALMILVDSPQAKEFGLKVLEGSASNGGSPSAMYALGIAYKNGSGLERDKQKAEYWLSKAADQGYEEAQNALQDSKKISVRRPQLLI
jgi:TPR repeat protein